MNKKQVNTRIMENYRKYHTPNCSNHIRRPINAIYINPSNSQKHELKKLEICYDIQKQGGQFITEAVRNQKDNKGKERRVDVVDLNTGIEFEIETNKKRAERFKGEKGVIVIKCWKEELKNKSRGFF